MHFRWNHFFFVFAKMFALEDQVHFSVQSSKIHFRLPIVCQFLFFPLNSFPYTICSNNACFRFCLSLNFISFQNHWVKIDLISFYVFFPLFYLCFSHAENGMFTRKRIEFYFHYFGISDSKASQLMSLRMSVPLRGFS